MNFFHELICVVGSVVLLFNLSGATYSGEPLEDVAKLKIVGGSDVLRGKWPWQTLILIKKHNQATGTLTLCGGTLIGAKWVLTAAHCVEHSLKMRVYFGVWNVTNRIEVGRVTRTAKRVIQHPCYDGTKGAAFSGFNLALIELNTYIFGFASACLDRGGSHDWKRLTSEKSLGGCVATGYGVTDNGNDAAILQKVEFSTVSMVACEAYGKDASRDKILCATDDKVTGKDTCKGDMGGPLVCPTSRSHCNGYYLTGVTLAGSSNCGEEGKPGIYAAVQPNISWIRSVMKNKTIKNENQAYHCESNEAEIKNVKNYEVLLPTISDSDTVLRAKTVGFLKMSPSSPVSGGEIPSKSSGT